MTTRKHEAIAIQPGAGTLAAMRIHEVVTSALLFFYGTPERTRLTIVLAFVMLLLGISMAQQTSGANACPVY